MVQVMSKTNVFNLPTSLHNHHRISVSTIKSASFSSSTSSIGLKPLSLSSRFGVKHQLNSISSSPQMSLGISKPQRWWEKGVQPNMREINGAQDLVDSLSKAGDKLVIVDFFSPGCGGCKALHPKICQLAEQNPDVEFFQVNYEEHKSMCYSLNVHVLPFFRFYRGAHGRVCSFSCTNATIKKFKDALAKYSPDRCSLGPPKGLEEKELIALASNRDLSFTYTPQPKPQEVVGAPHNPNLTPIPHPSTAFKPSLSLEEKEKKTFATTAPR